MESYPLEKILTVSASEYCESVGKKMSDYKLVGVHAFADAHHMTFPAFAKNIPTEAEVVVNYRLVIRTTRVAFIFESVYKYPSGTALIPKDKEDVEASE